MFVITAGGAVSRRLASRTVLTVTESLRTFNSRPIKTKKLFLLIRDLPLYRELHMQLPGHEGKPFLRVKRMDVPVLKAVDEMAVNLFESSHIGQRGQ